MTNVIESSVARNLPRPGAARYPALTRWRRELLAGERTIHVVDALWRAACSEAAAAECEATLPEIAAGYRAEARRIITTARMGTP